MERYRLSEIAPEAVSGDFAYPKITDFKDQTIGIVNVRFGEGHFGTYAVLTLDDGRRIRSSNVVILDQLMKLAGHLDGQTVTVVKVVKVPGKRFYKLTDPDPEQVKM